jgi:hypothetical protein
MAGPRVTTRLFYHKQPPDESMKISSVTDKDRRNTAARRNRVTSSAGGISRIFAEAMRQIGGVYGGRAMNQRSLMSKYAKIA